MKSKASSGSSLLLLEMMISILFFSMVAAVCVQVFVKAHLTAQDAENLSRAQSYASSGAELLGGKPDEEVAALLGGVVEDSGKIVVYYDKDWSVCSPQSAAFQMEIHTGEADGMKTGEIQVRKQEGESLFELSARKYLFGMGEEEAHG